MKKRTDIWMPLYIGDYLADTQDLGALESGAYLHLLMYSWKSGALPTDSERLRRIAKVDQDAWSNAWAMLKSFFVQAEDGGYVQPRLERERIAWEGKKASSAAKARVAAQGRWKQNAPSDASSIALRIPQAMPGRCPSPSPIDTRERENAREPASAKAPDTPAAPSPPSPQPAPPETLESLARDIAVAHPRSRQRSLKPAEVPIDAVVAIVAAINRETETGGDSRQAGLRLLRWVEDITAGVPPDRWKFIKDLKPFFEQREYRVSPENLTSGSQDRRAPAVTQRPMGLQASVFSGDSQTEGDAANTMLDHAKALQKHFREIGKEQAFRVQFPDHARILDNLEHQERTA